MSNCMAHVAGERQDVPIFFNGEPTCVQSVLRAGAVVVQGFRVVSAASFASSCAAAITNQELNVSIRDNCRCPLYPGSCVQVARVHTATCHCAVNAMHAHSINTTGGHHGGNGYSQQTTSCMRYSAAPLVRTRAKHVFCPHTTGD